MTMLNVMRALEDRVEMDSVMEKREEMRRLSNVVQALENLETQCADAEQFDEIRNFAERALKYYRQALYSQIHQE